MSGKQSPELHYLRLKQALIPLRLKSWPYAGMIYIREFNEDTDRTQLHVFENWCYLGTAQDEAELEEIVQADRSPAFDPDVYNLLQKSLDETVEVICLGHASRRSEFLNGH